MGECGLRCGVWTPGGLRRRTDKNEPRISGQDLRRRRVASSILEGRGRAVWRGNGWLGVFGVGRATASITIDVANASFAVLSLAAEGS